MPEDDCETCVPKDSQLGLFGEIPVEHDARWGKFLRILGEEVDRISPSRLAGVFDEKVSNISNALRERDRHYFRAEWLLWVIAHGPTDDVLRFLAALRGRDVAQPEVLTPEEELRRRRAAEAKLFGPEGSAAINREVYGR